MFDGEDNSTELAETGSMPRPVVTWEILNDPRLLAIDGGTKADLASGPISFAGGAISEGVASLPHDRSSKECVPSAVWAPGERTTEAVESTVNERNPIDVRAGSYRDSFFDSI